MSERPGGLESLLVVVNFVLPLHALLYDLTGVWVFTLHSIQKEQSRSQILHSWNEKEKEGEEGRGVGKLITLYLRCR